MKKATRIECGGCRHWRADMVDAFGRPAQEETKAFCAYHGTTTDRDDWCKHHSDHEEQED